MNKLIQTWKSKWKSNEVLKSTSSCWKIQPYLTLNVTDPLKSILGPVSPLVPTSVAFNKLVSTPSPPILTWIA